MTLKPQDFKLTIKYEFLTLIQKLPESQIYQEDLKHKSTPIHTHCKGTAYNNVDQPNQCKQPHVNSQSGISLLCFTAKHIFPTKSLMRLV